MAMWPLLPFRIIQRKTWIPYNLKNFIQITLNRIIILTDMTHNVVLQYKVIEIRSILCIDTKLARFVQMRLIM